MEYVVERQDADANDFEESVGMKDCPLSAIFRKERGLYRFLKPSYRFLKPPRPAPPFTVEVATTKGVYEISFGQDSRGVTIGAGDNSYDTRLDD